MKNIILILCTILLCSSALAGVDMLRAWRGVSDPLIMSTAFERNIKKLPLTAEARDAEMFWSSDYWAFNKGNINYRWNALKPSGFGYTSPSKEEALRMAPGELAQLSPSEKFDLFLGNYDYPLKREVAQRVSPDSPAWWGICHGWAPAAMNHKEPSPKDLVNPDGLIIPFGSSDIKALLSYYYAYKNQVLTTHQMGRRCEGGMFDNNCSEDLNAGAFHIVLANKVGLEGKSFIADMERGKEVWNHPIKNYHSVILDDNADVSRSPARGTYRTYHMRTDAYFVYQIKKNSWLPVLGTDLQSLVKRSYEYTLDINRKGEIIGGDWISRQRPDFLWLVPQTQVFEGMFSQLPLLLND